MGPTVAVDIGALVGPRTGVGQFVQRLLPALAGVPEPPRVVPYVLSARARLPAGARRLPFPAGLAVRTWGHLDRPTADRTLAGADVIHGPNYVVPPSRLPTVVTVHDCWFLRHPETVPPVVRRFGAVLRRAVARGATVHVPSQHTAAQARELLGVERVIVLPLGAPAVPTLSVPAAGGPPGLGGRPYLLALGTKEPRKNLPRLVEAFGLAAAAHPDVGLVLLGPDGPDRPAVDRALDALAPDVRGRVVLRDWVEDRERDAILGAASLLAFPSLDEGWGYPALEAMSFGVPVVAGRAGSLPEVCADAAELVDPLDPSAIADGIVRVLDDAMLRARLVDAGRRRVDELSIDRCALGFAELYRDLAADRVAP